MANYINKLSDKNIFYVTVFFSATLLVDYKYYIILISVLVISLIQTRDNLFFSNNHLTFRTIPIFFYIVEVTKFLLNKNKESIFWDMQLFLFRIKCNLDWSSHYRYKFSSEKIECTELGFGPAINFFKFDLDAWLFSILIFFAFLILLFYFLFKLSGMDLLIVAYFLVTPSFYFLMQSLNHDIFFLTLFTFLFRNYKIYNNIIFLTFLTFLTLFKIYSIGIFFGIFLFLISSKNLRENFKFLFVFILNLSLRVNYYFSNNISVPSPVSKIYSFGVFHDFNLIKNTSLLMSQIFILFYVLCIFYILFNSDKIFHVFFNKLLFKSNQEKFNTIVFTSLVLLILIYSNYGYKYVNIIFTLLIVLKYVNKKFTFPIITSVIFIPLNYFVGNQFQNSIYEILLFSLSRISFYFLHFLVILLFIKFLKSYVLKQDNKLY